MGRTAYALYFAANLAPRALMFGLTLVLTHLMPEGEYGLFVLVITTGEILDMGLGSWVRIFALRSESGSGGGTLRPRRLGRLIALTLAMTLLGLALAAAGSYGRREAAAYMAGIAAYVVAFASHRLGLVLLQIRRKHAAYAAVEALRAALTVAAASGAAVLVGPRFLPVALALAAATLLAGAVALSIALRGAPRPSRARTGYAASLVYGLPIVLASALGYSLGWVDRYIIDVLVGPAGVAVFAATYALARQPVELFLGPVNAYAFPHLIGVYERDGPEGAARAQAGLLATLLMIGTAIAVGLASLAPPLLDVVLPQSYRADGAEIVPWMALGTLILSVKLFVFDNVFHLAKKTWLQPPSMAPAAAISVGLSFFLIPRLGIGGVGIAYFVAAAASLVTTAAMAGRILPARIPWPALGRIALGNLAGFAALLAVRAALRGQGPLPVLVCCALAYAATYAGALTLLGTSIRRSLETPWDPGLTRRSRAAALLPSSDGAGR